MAIGELGHGYRTLREKVTAFLGMHSHSNDEDILKAIQKDNQELLQLRKDLEQWKAAYHNVQNDLSFKLECARITCRDLEHRLDI